jgi:molecular chaperone GrpE
MTSKEKTEDQAVKNQNTQVKTESAKARKTAATKAKPAKTGKKPEDPAKLKALQKELQEQKEKYLRLSADFDNFRKRTLKEKMELHKQAGESIYVKMLPVLDDLERAIKFMEEAKDMEAVKEGILLIYNKFKEYLNQQGVKEIDAIHQEFNTDVHEAVTQIPAEDKKLKGKVVDIIEKGYFLNDKVIRYSKVVIGI